MLKNTAHNYSLLQSTAHNDSLLQSTAHNDSHLPNSRPQLGMAVTNRGNSHAQLRHWVGEVTVIVYCALRLNDLKYNGLPFDGAAYKKVEY